MEYKLISDKNELDGTCYFEFLPGKYKDKCWNDNSVFLTLDIIEIIEDLLEKSNEKYDYYDFIYFDNEQISILENELSKRLIEIKNSEYKLDGKRFKNIKDNEKYYKKINKDIERNRNNIIEMLEKFIFWINLNKDNGITVLGM